jgi:glyoxylase-like metal-dependent hydrolase (beta-lactamase superfamily II)
MIDRDATDYAVYAIKFAHRDRSSRREHFYRSHGEPDEPMPITYYVWLIVGRGRCVLVDTGFTPEVAQRRGSRSYVRTPVDSLVALGIRPEHIDTVVLTHLHYDHTGFVGAFPSARLVVQRRELDYWRGPYAARGENPHLIEPADLDALLELERQDRVDVVDGDAELAPGLGVHLTGGHTAGLQVVAVECGERTVVIASDASHFLDNVEADRPYSIVDHLPSMYDAFDWMRARAGGDGAVVPGHDPEVMAHYPAVEGSDGITVRIA